MAFTATISLLVFSIIAANALIEDCPPFETTSSCSCTIKWGPSVTCTVKDVESLAATLQGLQGYAVDDLTLSEMKLSKLSPDQFQKLHINRLILDKFEVTSTDAIQFQGLEKTMTILEIDNSFKRQPLTNLKLDNLDNLESVMMMDNKINEVSNDWFASGPKKLFTILLERNGIKRLGDKAFQSLDGLQILWITGNSLSEVSRSMFPSNAKLLEKIDLSDNKIKQIPVGLFSDMPELVYVNLARNSIQTLAEDKSIMKNTGIHLEGNPLRCSNELSWICQKKVPLDIHTALCDSPDLMKGYSLKVFCDIKG